MSLAQYLENRFRGDIRFRGAAYLKAERSSLTRITADEVLGVVRDGVEFHTQIRRDNGAIRLGCSCWQGKPGEPACKHLWASILGVDAAGLVTGTIKGGQVPPFIAEADTLSPSTYLDDDWDDDDGDVYNPPEGRGVSSIVANTLVAPKLREWDAQLVKLRETMQGREAARSTTQREREVYYEIDLPQSRETGLLVLQTSYRERRGSGAWGKLKPLRLKTSQLGDFDELDRQVIAYLCGSTAEKAGTYPGMAESTGTPFRFQLPFALSELVLPNLCATGRLQVIQEDGEVGEPLRFDAGPAWELTLSVKFDETNQEWRLAGRLQRDTEELSLKETLLLIPGGFVVTSTNISRLRDAGVFEWVSLLQRPDPMVIPAGEEEEFVDRLLDMPAVPRLELPPQLNLETFVCDPVPSLAIFAPRGFRWQKERLQGELSFSYAGAMIRATSPQGAIVQRSFGRCLPRDKAQEEQAWQVLDELGFKRIVDPQRPQVDVEIPAKNLGAAVRVLVERGWQVRAEGKQVRQAGKLQFQVKTNIDWFELQAQVDFEGRSIPFPELLSALSRGDSTVRLDDGSLGILPEEWFQQYALLSGLGISQDNSIRFSRNQVGILDALLSAQEGVIYDEPFELLRQKLHEFSGIHTAVEPEGFVGKLRDYQREGFGWLRFLKEFKFGGCLADDMGLGKTIQLLALLRERLAHDPQCRPSLVVVPKSLIFNWQQECHTFTPDLKVLEYTGLERAQMRSEMAKHNVILTTYGTLRRDILHLKDFRFDYVVLDEAQAIKNDRSQVAKAARLLQADYRVALSGTPIENHLGDLWSIFEFLNPGMLGRASVFKPENLEATDNQSRQLLSRALKPFILRRTKKEVAGELPDRLEQTIYCQMGEEQSALYQELREHYRGSLLGLIQREGLAKSKIHVLEALLRLRQAACHPGLLRPEMAEGASAKLDTLLWNLEELLAEGHKVLVFSQFTSMLALVRPQLEKKNIQYEYLDGQTRKRKEHVERFQNDPACGVFLISLKAGGLGLNLTAADYVFILDPWWNPAVEAQAIDRAHRIGQQRHVFAYRLICKDTVEEKILSLQTQKRELAEAILQADNNLIRDLTAEDLELLLS